QSWCRDLVSMDTRESVALPQACSRADISRKYWGRRRSNQQRLVLERKRNYRLRADSVVAELPCEWHDPLGGRCLLEKKAQTIPPTQGRHLGRMRKDCCA